MYSEGIFVHVVDLMNLRAHGEAVQMARSLLGEVNGDLILEPGGISC